MMEQEILSIDWSQYKPKITKGTLLETIGPSSNGDRDPICIICHERLEVTQPTLRHPPCDHVGHKSCLTSWREYQYLKDGVVKCPVCRQSYGLRETIARIRHEEAKKDASAVRSRLQTLAGDMKSICNNEAVPKWFARNSLAQINTFFRPNGQFAETIHKTLEIHLSLVQSTTEDLLENGSTLDRAGKIMRSKAASGANAIIVRIGDLNVQVEKAKTAFIFARDAYRNVTCSLTSQIHLMLLKQAEDSLRTKFEEMLAQYLQEAINQRDAMVSLLLDQRKREWLQYHRIREELHVVTRRG